MFEGKQFSCRLFIHEFYFFLILYVILECKSLENKDTDKKLHCVLEK